MHTLLVSPSRENPVLGAIAAFLRAQGGFEAPEVVTPDRAEMSCRDGGPGLVVVVLARGQIDRTLDTVGRLRGAGAETIFVAGPATDPKLILRTIQAGADLFLDQDDLEAGLESALTRFRARRPDGERTGRLLAVLSASGGCGASTLAVNLATLLAKRHGECNLIDLNPGRADLAPLLDLRPPYTLADLCRNNDRLDRSMYEKLLVRHPGGVALLAAPRGFEPECPVTPRGVDRALALARELFPEVVVDLADCFHPEQVVALEQATRIFLVCRLDFSAIRNTRRILDHLTAQGIPRDRVEVVVNHSGQPNELPIAEAEFAIGGKLIHFVPYDPATLCSANNTGIPAATTNPDTAVVQGIARLVGLDTPPLAPGLLARLTGWVLGARSRWPWPKRPNTASGQSAGAEEMKISHEPLLAPEVPAPTDDARALSA
jgi:pilus assembly protein CpaE